MAGICANPQPEFFMATKSFFVKKAAVPVPVAYGVLKKFGMENTRNVRMWSIQFPTPLALPGNHPARRDC
jgi:hypothetical protein